MNSFDYMTEVQFEKFWKFWNKYLKATSVDCNGEEFGTFDEDTALS